MEIIITAWALDSYLELIRAKVFTPAEYKEILRKDALKLAHYPLDPSFSNGKFWSIATLNQEQIPGGFKMKWHNFGHQRVQLRLSVGMFSAAFLGHAYIKSDPKFEGRQMAKLKTRLELIRRGQYTECGRLL